MSDGQPAQKPEVPIRDAATVLVVRHRPRGPEILMGQRGDKAVFMPSKYVFPGGAVDKGDAAVPLAPGGRWNGWQMLKVMDTPGAPAPD